MYAIFWAWGISAGLLAVVAMFVGLRVTMHPMGVLIDSRGRYSLTHFQIVLWTIVVLSLIAGTVFGRWVSNVPGALNFTIPPQLLGVLGISLGSGVLTTVTKSSNDAMRPQSVAVSVPQSTAASVPSEQRANAGNEANQWRPRFLQVFMQEEGAFADRVIDITKFQNFFITVILVLAYIFAVIQAISDAGSPANFNSLPDFSSNFLVLLGISHGAYIAGKIPPQAGVPPLSVASRDAAVAATGN